MGSDSDLRVMRGAAEVLEAFGVDFEVCLSYFITCAKFLSIRGWKLSWFSLDTPLPDLCITKFSGDHSFSTPDTWKNVFFCFICWGTRGAGYHCWCWWCSSLARQVDNNFCTKNISIIVPPLPWLLGSNLRKLQFVGMVASLTDLPVIGVPVKTTSLNGVDSVLSILQVCVSILSFVSLS